MATLGGTGSTTYNFSDDSEGEFDWEEVAVPQAAQVEPEEDEAGPSTRLNIEVTLEAYPAQGKDGKQKKPPGAISHAERLLRIDCHKVHTVALIANAAIRNRWINDELLQARLLSLTPLAIQNSFAMIHKSRIPDDVKRGYLFEQAVSRLASWWADTFFAVKPMGHLRNRTFEDVQRALHSKGLVDVSGKGKGKAPPQGVDPLEDLFDNDDEVEIVRSAKSLMKHALMRSGSRDVSSQLFTALCRALGLPARLVVSLQSVPWQTNVGRPKTPAKHKGSSSKGKGKAVELRDAESSDEDMREGGGSRQNGHLSGDDIQVDEDVVDKTSPATSNGKGKSSHTVKLRKSKSSGRMSGSPRPSKPSDPLTTPPVFWTEVFSRPDGRWIPVDPIRAIVNKRKVFDPTPVGTWSRPAVIDNRMMYVLGVEEDGYMRDVTPRYARQYSAKVAKAQSGGKGRREWWTQVTRTVTRPYRLHRDDVEDDELIVNQFTEGMPTTIGGFKDHPFYVLERHLHRDQIISRDAHELGKFRGESVYSRSQVLQLKAAENWMRHGRVVRTGEQPLKYVKQRAVTLNRRRELEIRADAEGANGSGDIMQGLYAERQTEIYVPPPVVDGKIPKNNFGNIDLYTPSMLPAGAAHIPHKGAAKIARQLGFDHAEAVTSFEFRKGKAFPVISGIVIAAENEDTILEAYWETEHAAAQKEQEKRRQAVLKRWTKLVQGLRIRQRVREQYGSTGVGDVTPSPTAATGNDDDGEDVGTQPLTAGGFLTGVEDVVQHYNLPRPTHAVFSSPPRSPNPDGRASPAAPTAPPTPFGTFVPGTLLGSSSSSASIDDEDLAPTPDDAGEGDAHVPPFPAEDEELETETAGTGTGTAGGAQSQPQRPRRRMPKSMAELAAEAAQAQAAGDVAVADVASPQMGHLQEAPPASASASSIIAPSSRTTRAASKAKAEPKPKPKPRMKTRRGKRARAQDDDQDSDSNEDEGWESRSGGEPRVAAKRARKQRQDGLDPDVGVEDEVVLVPPTNRVLRTRKVTSPEQLAREREQELAVRRALAG